MSETLVQDIGERLKAADLIESRHLLQAYSSMKDDYFTKQPLSPRKKDYLDIAHLVPEASRYGGVKSLPVLGDVYQSGKEDAGRLLDNKYLAFTALKGGIGEMYLCR